jgi:hypothetical protein
MSEQQTPTIQEIRAEVRAMDPHLKPWNPSFKSAVLLLSLLVVGPDDITTLASFSRLPRSFVETRVARLRANGIVTAEGKVAAAWFDTAGAEAFWLDVCVAEGLMKRAS